MKKFVIEREIPGAGKMSPQELQAASKHSNDVLATLGPDITWDHSYVAGDKLYCIYSAPSEELIRRHAKESGFPANKITELAAVISPKTGQGGA